MALGKITHTPEGLADILCDECELKFKIEQSTREIFKTYGYKMVQTPTFEYYDVYDISTPTKAENMFKFFDTNGRMLALRPDFTTSIARMAATKPIGNELPLKLSYSGSAFRNEENFSQARQREFTQLGVEFMGDARPEADAEIIEIAINTLLKAGIKQFQIDIGQVEFFKGLVEDAGLDIAQVDTFRELIDGKDFIGIENVLDEYNLNSHLRDIFL
ncbi:MAG: ATP phosphoribosyltransferase regulatory subunit, partial [Oscillospiraceae bacterium]